MKAALRVFQLAEHWDKRLAEPKAARWEHLRVDLRVGYLAALRAAQKAFL